MESNFSPHQGKRFNQVECSIVSYELIMKLIVETKRMIKKDFQKIKPS